jgi:methylmalonyl-CoA/ethylmalonyl-CoA epimerase
VSASERHLPLDHIAIAVPDLDAALAFWRDRLGARCAGTEEVPSEKVRVAFLETGAAKTELLEPTSSDSPIARFLARGGKGLHHVAYRVADLDAELGCAPPGSA